MSRGYRKDELKKELSEFDCGPLIEIIKSPFQDEISCVALVTDEGYVNLQTSEQYNYGELMDNVYGIVLPVGVKVTLENEEE